MKREYYVDCEEVTRHTFFKYLEVEVYNQWRNNNSEWWCFEDYYAYIKTEIRKGGNFNYVHTFWSEVIR